MNLLPTFQKTRFFEREFAGKKGWQNSAMLKFVPDCYKKQRMCNKAVDTYANALRFVPNCYKTQEMFNKAVGTHASAMQLVPDWCKTQPMCDKVAFKEPFMLKYCIDRHKAQ